MAAKKPAACKTASKKRCPDCKDVGQISETFQVGARKKRDSPHKQEALCLTCWGSGEAPTA
ncbi:hypothetical protein CP981_12100 [Streptomyces platensis]|uniref:Uncharacterized protein n=1 Tax=Streptomyces platensis TaxID=58346 RepID=A0AAE6TPB5_STRPT|nr:hypothetical protein [Streptomyces platensis]OSY43420.1 hypothetical protein BG653_04564 [Streptomyces platensis]QEV52308.1 hypothetical protein CP981_12100 [Streptomyces platensis]